MKHSEINWPHLINLGKKLVGKPYVFGAEVSLKNPDPDHIKAIDCSELVEWLFAQINISMPDGSYNQAKMCRPLKFDQGIGSDVLLIGDLGFKWNPDTEAIHHVGIFIGEGTVLEAKGKKWGVVQTPFADYTKSDHFAYWGRLKTVEDA
ncbi:MAG TPA: NlpC/P60 family protein [Prosthecobacter sp.]|nr:NlpC/P60 family protein [Prosthecobacter sp.]